MKILKYLFSLIIVLLLVSSVLAFMQPKHYHISSSKLFKAPATILFNSVKDPQNFKLWYPSVFRNAIHKSAVSEADHYIEQRLLSDKISPPATIYWRFEEIDDTTKVTLGIKGDADITFRAFAGIKGGFENLFSKMPEKNLNKLDTVITELIKYLPPKIDIKPYAATYKTPTLVKLERQQFIGYRHKIVANEQQKLTDLFLQDIPKITQFTEYQNTNENNYFMGSFHQQSTTENNSLDIILGALVARDLAPNKKMYREDLPDGNYLSLSIFGKNNDARKIAHENMKRYLMATNLEQIGPVLELFIPPSESDSIEEIKTNIFYAVKAKEGL